MKDSTWILILGATALFGVGTLLRQVAEAAEMIEQVRFAAVAHAEVQPIVSSNRTVRLQCDGHNLMKGWFSL